jgi:phospholipid/cholesterol/gamma-HCH transport system substrate-binding protein
MTARTALRRVLAVGCCVMLTSTGCAFHGLNSLPLPGAVGRGPGSDVYHVEIGNVVTLESNSPVMIDDVIVGSVGPMTVKNWHADVEITV